MVTTFLPVSGQDSMWDARGGNSKSVRNTELMMECNDGLFEGWNDQTPKNRKTPNFRLIFRLILRLILFPPNFPPNCREGDLGFRV